MRGADLLDTEFRGGVSIVMETKPEGEGRLMLARAEVEQEIRALANEISTADVDPLTEDGQRALILSQLGSAAVVTVGETATDAEGNTTASRFQVKVATPAELPVDVAIDRVVVDTLVDRFSDRLDIDPSRDVCRDGRPKPRRPRHGGHPSHIGWCIGPGGHSRPNHRHARRRSGSLGRSVTSVDRR